MHLITGAALVLAGGLLGAGLILALSGFPGGNHDPSSNRTVTSPPTPGSSGAIGEASVSPSPSHPTGRPVVSIVFGRQEWAKGARLALHLYEPPYPDEECIVHTYELGGRTLGAFQSNCASWTRNGYDILIFGVGFRNRSQLPLTIRLRNFVLISRDGRAFSPVNVRSEARFPPLFLPETQFLIG
jgi:hypothetical protein